MTFLTIGIICVCHLCSTGKEFTNQKLWRARDLRPMNYIEAKGQWLLIDQEEMKKSQSRIADHWN